jgi:hypothetical protein
MLIFRLKEVLPIKKKAFWGDLKVARKIYQKRAVMVVTTDLGLEEQDEVRAGGRGKSGLGMSTPACLHSPTLLEGSRL